MKNKQYFTHYYAAQSRNNYGAIDCLEMQSTGCENVTAGITRKLSREMAGALNSAYCQGIFHALAAYLSDSELTNYLYEMITNDGDLYRSALVPFQESFVKLKQGKGSYYDAPEYSTRNLMHSLAQWYSRHEAEIVGKDEDSPFHERLRFHQGIVPYAELCAVVINYLQYCEAEYRANGLREVA